MSLIEQILAEALEDCPETLHYGCHNADGKSLTAAGRALAEALSPLWREALDNHQDGQGYYHRTEC